MKSLLTRRPTLSFFVLTFALAWSYWLALGFVVKVPATALILPGAWAPSVVALGLSALLGGRARVKELLERLFRWRVAPVWYRSAILGPSLLAACALGVDALVGGTLPALATLTARFGLQAKQAPLFLMLLPVVYLVTVFAGGPVAEELGWRGFTQARLTPSFGALGSGLVIGVFWALWHLPLFGCRLPRLATFLYPLSWRSCQPGVRCWACSWNKLEAASSSPSWRTQASASSSARLSCSP